MVRELEEERSRRLTIVVDTLADVGDDGHAARRVLHGRRIHRPRRVRRGSHHAHDLVRVRAGPSTCRTTWTRGRSVAGSPRSCPTGCRSPSSSTECADAFRDVDVVVLIFPTWRTNGDGALVAGDRGDVGRRTRPSSRCRSRSGPTTRSGSRRCGPIEVDGLVSALVRSGADVYPWRHGTPLDVRAHPGTGGDGVTVATSLSRGCAAAREPPRNPWRCASSSPVAVEVAILAVVAQGGVNGHGGDPAARAGARRLRVLVPAASPLEPHDQGVALGGTARGVRGVPAERPTGGLGRPGARAAGVVVPLGAGAPRVRRAATSRPGVLDGLQRDPDGGGRRALPLVVVRVVRDPVGGPQRRVAVPVEPAALGRHHAARLGSPSADGARWNGGIGPRGGVDGIVRRARDRARLHGDPEAPRDAHPVAAVLARGRRIGGFELRRRRGEPVAAGGSRATAS